HNLKYWTRRPYLGFGVDAHSMLPASPGSRAQGVESLRFSTTDSFDQFFVSAETKATPVTEGQALEESFFLGLRLNRRIDLHEIRQSFGAEVERFVPVVDELVADSLLDRGASAIRLTPRGCLLSNEVFEKFILEAQSRAGLQACGKAGEETGS